MWLAEPGQSASAAAASVRPGGRRLADGGAATKSNGLSQPAGWWATGVAVLLICLLAAVAVFLALRRHDTFHTSFFDTGSYTQLVWNLAHGRWFVWSHSPPNYLGDHFSPLLVILAPLFWFAPDARTLQVAGMLALATSLVPGFLILRTKYPLLGPLLVLGLVLNPLLHASASEDIHTILLAATTVGIAIYALHTSRYRLLVVALALTLMAREDMPIYVGSFGLFLFLFRPGRRRLGFAIGVGAVVWLLVTTLLIMPALNEGSYRHGDQIQGILANLRAAAAALAAEPRNASQLFLSSSFALNLARVLLPLALLPLLAGEYALLWAPALLILLLSPEADSSGLGQGWRLAPLLPLWFGSTGIAISRLGQRRALLAALALVICSLISFRIWSQFPGGERFDPSQYAAGKRTEALQAVLRLVPPDIAVAATNQLGAHLGTRERHQMFPLFSTQNPPDIAIVDASGQDLFPLKSAGELQAAVEALRLDPAVRAIWRQGDILVFSFSETSPFPNNYGVPLYYYEQALAKARGLLAATPGSTVYLRSDGDVADRVQALGQASGLRVRVSSSADALLLAQDGGGDHLYVVPSGDTATSERLRTVGFTELGGERIVLPGGEQSLGFYRLQGDAGARLAGALSRLGPDVRLSNGLRLYRWQAPNDLRGLVTLPLATAWEVWDNPKQLGADDDLCLSQHLLDVTGKSLAVADTKLEPTRFLRQGDLLISWSRIPLATGLELQQAWMQVGLFGCWQREPATALDGAGKPVAGGVNFGPFKVGSPDLAAQPAQPGFALQAALGDAVRLTGYDASAQVIAGMGALRLTMHWLAEKKPAADYTVFVQLLRDGKLVAQYDGQPRDGKYPTSTWDAGEVVVDTAALVLPAQLAPGEYRLITGMYTPADTRRLAVKQAEADADFVDLGGVTVAADGSLRFGQR